MPTPARSLFPKLAFFISLLKMQDTQTMTEGGILDYNGLSGSCNNLAARHMQSHNIGKVEF